MNQPKLANELFISFSAKITPARDRVVVVMVVVGIKKEELQRKSIQLTVLQQNVKIHSIIGSYIDIFELMGKEKNQ